jgi:ankyrin repeat protein
MLTRLEFMRKAVLGTAFLLLSRVGGMADEAAERALIVSAINGDIDGVRRALKDGASINVRDVRGRSALLIATYRNDVEMAQVLIAAGADVNARDNIEDTPFLYAGAEGRNDILRMALEAGADVKSTNRYGGTALIPAAHHGHPETVAILLLTRIDRNHVNKLGWTALLEAVILGDGGPTYERIVRMLVKAGADPNIADRDGVTPLAHARNRGYREIARILEAAGAR